MRCTKEELEAALAATETYAMVAIEDSWIDSSGNW